MMQPKGCRCPGSHALHRDCPARPEDPRANATECPTLAGLLERLDLELTRSRPLPRLQPPRRPASDFRRPGRRPVAHRRVPNGRRAASHIRCTAISCVRAIPRFLSSIMSTAFGTGARSRRGASWPSSTAKRFSTCRFPFRRRRRASNTRPTCLKRRRRRPFPRTYERLRAYKDRSGHPAIDFLLMLDRPIERREVDHVDLLDPKPRAGIQRTWFRAAGRSTTTRSIHQAVLAYASDYGLLEASFTQHGDSFLTDKLIIASLDHAIWFHQACRADRVDALRDRQPPHRWRARTEFWSDLLRGRSARRIGRARGFDEEPEAAMSRRAHALGSSHRLGRPRWISGAGSDRPAAARLLEDAGTR